MAEIALIGLFDDNCASGWVIHALQDAGFQPAICEHYQQTTEQNEARRHSREEFVDAGSNFGLLIGGFVGFAIFPHVSETNVFYGTLLIIFGFLGLGIGYLAGAQCGFLAYKSTVPETVPQIMRAFVSVPIKDSADIKRAECIMKEFCAIDTYVQESVAA